MMEKAKTASSTSHSSETWWRGTMHALPPKLTKARSVAQALSHRLVHFVRGSGQWRMALVFSSRWNTEAMGGGPGGPGGAAGCCTQMSTAATRMRATPKQ